MNDRFLLEVKALSAELRVARFSGQEGLSELFRFDVEVLCDDATVDFAAAIGAPALLTLTGQGGAAERHVHGMVARFAQGALGKKLTAYHVTLVPRAWRLLHRHDCRIFQGKTGDDNTAPDIITAVLVGAGLARGTDFRLSLQGSYVSREYCVQYRESDWAFVSRLMEEEGIHYFFEHTADGHVLVIGDNPNAHSPIVGDATVPFHADTGALGKAEHVTDFRYAEEMRSGAVALRDYDFKRPSLLLESKAAGDTFADLEVYDHPGDYDAPATGAALARVRLEERAVLQKSADGEGVCARFTPGHRFTLADHTRDALNAAWLLTRVDHRGVEPSFVDHGADGEHIYDNHFACIRAAVPFRPPLVTPRPTIKGVQSAIVTGPAGEEIHTDEHGRVKVQFHWDRLGKNDDKSSCWMRVSQLWAGEGWGAMFIPRVGHEVLVDFLDGDPDRPIVVGRVYHGVNRPPCALPADRTRSTIKSNSTPGGGGSNELRFEDKKGSEEVYLHAQKDWTIAVEHDKNQTVGHDETLAVTHDRSAQIGHDQTASIGNDETFSVGHDESQSVGHDRTISVGNDHTESIGGSMTLSVAKTKTEDVSEDSGESVGKTRTLSTGKDYAVDVKGDMSTAVGGNQSDDVKLAKTITVGNKLTITVGSATVTVEKNGNVTVQGAKLSVSTTGDVNVEASGTVNVKSSADVNVEATGKVSVKSSGTMDVNASGAVKLKGANVGIN